MVTNWLKRLPRFLSRRVIDRTDTYRSPNPQDLGVTYAGLNFEAARRQAQLGRDYARTGRTVQQLKELKRGRVVLPPHRAWDGNYTDWEADPFNDRNWRFQFHTLRWINPYLWDALAGHDESALEWKRIVHSWAQHNTPPHRAPDNLAWLDMTDGNRAIQISIGAPLVDTEDDWYIELLVQHRNWLFDDSNIVPGNHGLHQNLGLFVVAAVLDDEPGIHKSIQRLTSQVIEAFDFDGLNEEGSVGYHQMNLIWWHQAQHRLKLEGHSFPDAAAERLDKAGRTLGMLLLPDGSMPQIGDGNRGKARRGLHPFLDQVIKGKIREKDAPIYQQYENGLTVFRSGWGQTRPLNKEAHTIVRHGRDLERHSHDDRGSIHIYTQGRRWITDGGFHSYQQNDPDRIYTKSRLAHSLIDLPHQNHNIGGDVPLLLSEHTDRLHSIETLDDNFDTAMWKRRVVFLPEERIWVIWDRVESEAEELIQQQWLIDIGIDVRQILETQLTLHSEGEELHMQWLGDRPTFDIAQKTPQTGSKRGLIGVGWKNMKPTTSVHALFQTKHLESIVVISESNETSLDAEITLRDPMNSFELELRNSSWFILLKFEESTTEVVQNS